MNNMKGTASAPIEKLDVAVFTLLNFGIFYISCQEAGFIETAKLYGELVGILAPTALLAATGVFLK